MALTHYRIVVMGSGGVGKTSLISQFIKGDFGGAYFPTIENTYKHSVTMSDGESHTIELIDTAGLHIVPAMRQLSIKSGKAFILVYDITNMLSFLNALDLADDIADVKGAKRTPMIIVGNKCDLKDRREVSAQEGQSEAAKRNCSFMETTGRDNASVRTMFMELLTKIFPVKTQHNSRQQKKKKMKLSSSKTALSKAKESGGEVQEAGDGGGNSKDVNEKFIKENMEKEAKENPTEEKTGKKTPRARQCAIL